MSQLTHIFVTVPEGREVPVPAGDASAPGGVLLRCMPGKVYRVPYSGYTRKRLRMDDFIPCNARGTKVPELEQANAGTDPEAYETDELGAITGTAKKPEPATTATTAPTTKKG